MFAAAESIAETLRVLRFAPCILELVVTPLITETEQVVNAFTIAPLETRVNSALAVPECAPDIAKVVEPHPHMDGKDRAENENEGSLSFKVSPMLTGVLRENIKSSAVCAAVTGFGTGSEFVLGFENCKTVLTNAASITADDVATGVAPTFGAFASEAASVRSL